MRNEPPVWNIERRQLNVQRRIEEIRGTKTIVGPSAPRRASTRPDTPTRPPSGNPSQISNPPAFNVQRPRRFPTVGPSAPRRAATQSDRRDQPDVPTTPRRAAEPTRLRWATPLTRAVTFTALVRLVLGILTAAPLHAQSSGDPNLSEIRAELSGPIRLLLDNGNRQTGRVADWDGETLQLDVDLGAGSAQMTFAAENIRDIHFPGRQYRDLLARWMRDPDRTDDALELFRAYYRQQGAFFQFLDASDLNLFVEYIRFAIESDKPLRAVAMIEVLRPHIDDPQRLKALDDSILLAFFQAGMLDEAADQAATWVEAAPPAGDSALGWRILADIQFREEAYEQALWTALYPIAFANQILPDHLDACYAFAIAAADETRQRDLKARLAREMRERGLAWPSKIERLQTYEPPPPPEPTTEDTEATAEPNAEPEPEPEPEELMEPIQTPSPLDPMESLPTRILRRDET